MGQKLRKQLLRLPEIVLITLLALGAYTPPFSFNPLLTGIILLFIFQLIKNHTIFGLILGVLGSLGALLFLGALLSEFHEFDAFTDKAQQLLYVGIPIWMVCMACTSGMIYKYASRGNLNNSKLQLEK